MSSACFVRMQEYVRTTVPGTPAIIINTHNWASNALAPDGRGHEIASFNFAS